MSGLDNMLALLAELPAPVFVALMALMGLVVGSFLNVVIYRLPIMLERERWADATILLGDETSHRRVFAQKRSVRTIQAESDLVNGFDKVSDLDLIRPASRCGTCGHRIRPWENVPVLSWLMLRGKCSACGTRISARYPLVEAGCAALFGLVAWRFGVSLDAFAWSAFVAMALSAAMIDWDTKTLPDVIVIPLVWQGLIASSVGWLSHITAAQSIAGAVIGYGALLFIARGFQLITGRIGMGGGDFKLMAAIGAWVGAYALIPVVTLACVLTLMGIAVSKVTGRAAKDNLYPFGPALFASAIAGMLLDLPALIAVVSVA